MMQNDIPSYRLCLVTETYLPEINGVAKTLEKLFSGLRAKGHEVQIIRPRQKSENSASTQSDILVKSLPLPGYKELQFGLPAGRLIQQLWQNNLPDAIYIATEGPLGWSAMQAAKRLGIPIVSGFHTNFPAYSKHYRLRYLESLVARYLKNFHNKTQRTLVPTPEFKSALENKQYLNVDVMSRGVDTTFFCPEKYDSDLRKNWGLAEDEKAVLYVGRLAAEKNIDLAIRCFREMQKEDGKVKFVLVGDGPMSSQLRKKHPDFIFSGMQTGESLAKHYASGDILLFPSETETFGNVILEGLASGLAVVAYDYAAAKVHVNNSVSGVKAPLGDEETFIDLATALLRFPNNIRFIRSNSRTQAQRADWTAIISKLENTFLDVIEENSNHVTKQSDRDIQLCG